MLRTERDRYGRVPIEHIRPDLILPAGKRKGHSPRLASIYRAFAEYDKCRRHPDAIEQARAEFTTEQTGRLTTTTALADITAVSHIRPISPEYRGDPQVRNVVPVAHNVRHV